jgi:cytochrome P450 monooxygenase
MIFWVGIHMIGNIQLSLLGILLIYLFCRRPNTKLNHIPIVKFNAYLPDLINRLIYYPKAWLMIQQGYEQV